MSQRPILTTAERRMVAAILREREAARVRRNRCIAGVIAVVVIVGGMVATAREAAAHTADLAGLSDTSLASALHSWMLAHYTDRNVGVALIVIALLMLAVGWFRTATGRTVGTAPRSMGATR